MVLAPFSNRIRYTKCRCIFPAPFLFQGLLCGLYALIVPCGDFNFPEDLCGQAADRSSQGIGSLPGIEIEYIQKILVFKISIRIIRTPAVQAVGDAGCRGPPECHSGFKSIIPCQITVLNDVEDLPAVVIPVIGGKTFCSRIDHRFQGLTLTADFKSLFQGRHDRFPVFFLHLPELHRPGISALSGIRNIKNIAKAWSVAAGIDQGNPL
ncbi:MAG: hypothetical protein J6D13_07495 [Clostridium sp.]|nr:hypothetical protein [Clostridium sp.]